MTDMGTEPRSAHPVSQAPTLRGTALRAGWLRMWLRFVQVWLIMLGHGIAALGEAAVSWLPRERRRPGSRGATRLRRAAQGLGVSYMKLGQLLSTRADLLPDRYRQELARLREDAPPMALRTVRHQVESSFGRPVEAMFSSFSPEPVAAATISQVHEATLPDGRRVAVKVRRPGINDRIRADMALLALGARMAQRLSKTARLCDMTGVVAELGTMLHEETDFLAEARHAATIRALFADDPTVLIPEMLPDLSSPSVIVMEFIDGVSLGDVTGLEAAGLSRSHLAASVIRANVAMLSGPTLFHADLHPGNLVALPDGRLALLDFGATGSTHSETTKIAMTTVFEALMRGDPEGLTEGVLALTTAVQPVDREQLSGELDRSLLQPLSNSLGAINVGQLLRDLVAILRAHGLRVRTEMTVLVRAVLTCESTARELDPEISFRRVVVPFMVARAFGNPAPVAGLPEQADQGQEAEVEQEDAGQQGPDESPMDAPSVDHPDDPPTAQRLQIQA